MAKVKRKKIIIDAPYYSFDKYYEAEMSFFDDKNVISIHVLYMKEDDSRIKETYLVFYEDIEEEE